MNDKNNTGKNLNWEDDDLKVTAPTLFNLQKGKPFNAPEGYFDSLPAIIQQKCAEDNNISVFSNFFRLLSGHRLISASLALLIIIATAYLFIHLPDKGLENTVVASEEYLLEIDEAVLIETLSNSDDYNVINDNYDKATIDYLLENSIELQTIINEL